SPIETPIGADRERRFHQKSLAHSNGELLMRSSMKRFFSHWYLDNIKVGRRLIVSVVGATVFLIGIALLVLPGPAFVVIPVGLAILATEYAWHVCGSEKFVDLRVTLSPVGSEHQFPI